MKTLDYKEVIIIESITSQEQEKGEKKREKRKEKREGGEASCLYILTRRSHMRREGKGSVMMSYLGTCAILLHNISRTVSLYDIYADQCIIRLEAERL